jgi:Rrf2 family protein
MRASIALHVVAVLAREPARLHSSAELGVAVPASRSHLTGTLTRLVRAGVLASVRGPRGGFRLAAPPARFTLRDVFEAAEGRVERPQRGRCGLGLGSACPFDRILRRVNDSLLEHLAATRLDGFAQEVGGAQPTGR